MNPAAPAAREFAAYACLVLAGAALVYLILSLTIGCDPRDTTAEQLAEQDRIAVYVKAYGDELDVCIAKGKAAHDFAAYERCAVDVDKRFGRKDGGQ